MFMANPMPPSVAYHVTPTRVEASHARIETRGHELSLNIKNGSGQAGCAKGACRSRRCGGIADHARALQSHP